MDTLLLQYRLRSKRQKIRIQKEDRDKQLLKLDHEHNRLWTDPERISIIPLAEPYQRGWKRLFVLKPAIANSDKAEFYQQILNTINKVQYHYDGSFKKTKRKTYNRYNLDLPELQTLSRYDWRMNKVKLSEAQRELFNKVDEWDATYYRWTYKYQFALPHIFKIAVLPNMVTTIRLRDVEMDSRISFIDDQLDKTGGRYRLTKIQGGYYKYWKGVYPEKNKYVNRLKNKPKWAWVDEY